MTETEDWGPIDPTQQDLARMNATGVTWWAAEDEHGKPVQIENAVKGRTYHCPECETQMIPVQGANCFEDASSHMCKSACAGIKTSCTTVNV